MHGGYCNVNSYLPAQKQIIEVAPGNHMMTDEEHALAAGQIWNHEKGMLLAILALLWISKVWGNSTHQILKLILLTSSTYTAGIYQCEWSGYGKVIWIWQLGKISSDFRLGLKFK